MGPQATHIATAAGTILAIGALIGVLTNIPSLQDVLLFGMVGIAACFLVAAGMIFARRQTGRKTDFDREGAIKSADARRKG